MILNQYNGSIAYCERSKRQVQYTQLRRTVASWLMTL